MAYEQLNSAANKGADKATSAVDTLTKGNAPLRMMALVSLGVLVYCQVMHLLSISKFIRNPFKWLTVIYVLIAGVIGLSIEGVDGMPCMQHAMQSLRTIITDRFPFLHRLGGRGITYFILGSLTAAEGSLLPITPLMEFVAGCCLMACGFISALVARAAKNTLREIGRDKAEEATKLFPEHATAREGAEHVLNAEGLAKICDKLGKPLTPNQAAAALTMMDLDQSGGISEAEFKVFWTKLHHDAVPVHP